MSSTHSSSHLNESGIMVSSIASYPSTAGVTETSPPSSSPPQPAPSSSSEESLILYKPPTFWSIIRGAAINLFLPFVNGMMLGFGELFAHEAAFRLGWGGTKVFPLSRRRVHPIGPGVEIAERPKPRNMDFLTSLE